VDFRSSRETTVLIQDKEDGLGEARLLHPGDAGWFAVMRKLPSGHWMSRCHPLSQVETVVGAMARNPDIYISQASFTAPKRRLALLSQIRAAWVDIDCYNRGQAADQEFIEEVVERAVSAGLPRPTYVIRSGRGLYAKWIFEHCVDAANLPVWNALQSSLVATFRAIGADVRARDAARVLRALGSSNSKAADQAPVHMAWTSSELVDFRQLCEAASRVQIEPAHEIASPEPSARSGTDKLERLARLAEAERRKKALAELTPSITHLSALDLYAQTREPILLESQGARGLSWKRFLDLRKLAHLRGGVQRGERDNFLFWMMTFLSHAKVVTAANFWQELQALSQFVESEDFQPTRDGSMSTLYERLKAHRKGVGCVGSSVYTPTNQTIIELLEITPQEQQQLATLISPDEKRRRSDERNPGRFERRARIEEIRPLALSLLEQGTPMAEVARQTGVDRRQLYRWRQARELVERHSSISSRSGRAQAVKASSIKGHLLNKVADMLAAKKSHRQIGLELGLSESAMRRAVEQLRKLSALPGMIPVSPSPIPEKELVARQELAAQALEMRCQANLLLAQARDARSRLALTSQVERLRLRRGLARPGPVTRPAQAAEDLFGRCHTEEPLAAAVMQLQQLQQRARQAQAAADQAFAQLMHRIGAPLGAAPGGVCNTGSWDTSHNGVSDHERQPGTPGTQPPELSAVPPRAAEEGPGSSQTATRPSRSPGDAGSGACRRRAGSPFEILAREHASRPHPRALPRGKPQGPAAPRA